MENKAFLKPQEQDTKRTPGSYGFYTSNSDSSQIEIGKADRNIQTIFPGTGVSKDKNTKLRKVIETTGGY